MKRMEIRNDLYCPFCGNKGMRPYADSHRAQSGKRRYCCTGCKRRTTGPLYSEPQLLPKTKITQLRKYRFFVITSAVNDTPLVTAEHETFKRIAEENGGCYLIIPGVYKNPDLKHQGVINNYTWPKEIEPHVCNVNFKLNKSIIIRGQTRIQYTAINPLSGMNHASGGESEIYAHPQVAMEMIATPKNALPKMLHTTGTISAANYGDSKQAQKAEFHHSISAVIVELEGDNFYPREIHFDGTGAYDLDRYYTPDGYTSGHRVAGIVYGDIHARSLRQRIKTLMRHVEHRLNPEKQVFHDVHDNHIGGHHKDGDVLFYLKKAADGELSIENELMLSVEFLNGYDGAYIVDSNHHRHIDQWFNRFNPKNDPLNAPLYFNLAELATRDIKSGGTGEDLFKLFIRDRCSVPLNFVDCDDSFYIRKIDCSQHGDRGANGSRGSAKSFSKTGHKTMIGHSHTPRIEKGCYQVGIASPDLEYAKGLSSWMNTHGIIYDNGKRALFNIVNDKLSPSMRRIQ